MFDEILVVPIPEIKVYERLRYLEQPERILDCKGKRLRNKEITLVKVQ